MRLQLVSDKCRLVHFYSSLMCSALGFNTTLTTMLYGWLLGVNFNCHANEKCQHKIRQERDEKASFECFEVFVNENNMRKAQVAATMTFLFKSFVSAVVGNYSNWWQQRKKHQNFLSLVTFSPSLRLLVLGELSFNKVFLSLLLVISTVTLTLSSSHNFFPTRVTILIGTTCKFMLRLDESLKKF